MPTPRLARLLFPFLAAIGFAVACDNDQRVNNLPPPVKEVIGASGGSITGPSGTFIAFPPGAISGDATEITVTQIPQPAPPAGAAVIGAPIRLEPSGKAFDQPVEVMLTINTTALPAGTAIADVRVMRAPTGTTDFVTLPTRPAGPSAVAAVTEHFSDFISIVMVSDAGVMPCGDATCDAADGETCATCPTDCGLCFTTTNSVCGDLQCEGTETCPTCPYDCPCATPCQVDNGGCAASATCTYDGSAIRCGCPVGTIDVNLDGTDCRVAGSCGAGSCMNGGTCTDLASGFECACPDGFIGARCETAFDPCASNPCSNDGLCVAYGGTSYGCDCVNGYTGADCSGAPVGPCAGSPCQNGGRCQETGATSYACDCTGTSFGGTLCDVAIAVCGDGTVHASEACDDGGVASGDGCSTTCAVETGYSCVGMPSVCTDDNECALGTAGCDVNATCTNTAGAFGCACNGGFTGDGFTCTAVALCGNGVLEGVEACDDANVMPGDGCNATCAQELGFTCPVSGGPCTDVDECALGTAGCDPNATCVNLPGASSCTCNVGYSGDGRTCVLAAACGDGALDVGEACDDGGLAPGDGCDASCVVEFGYGCLGEPSVCADLDECALGTAGCDVNATCANAVGGFSCACNAGYSGDGLSCLDDNECALGTAGCDANAICTNSVGGFSCACNAGYAGDGFSCAFIAVCGDGLLTAPEACDDANVMPGDGCDAACGAVEAGYTCVTPGAACIDDDECLAGTDNCDVNAACTNTVGGFSCACDAGFTGDGVVCADDDECALGTNNCDANATCTNTAGGFSCACNVNYIGDGVTCSLLAACGNGVLDGGEGCDDGGLAAGDGCGATCGVETGYGCAGEPSVCGDLDECALGTAGCDVNAACTNTVGGFSCACNAGYAGDGFSCAFIAVCGDGLITMPEACDDGNVAGGDGCDASCGAVEAGYTCLAPGMPCLDDNECALGTHDCDVNAACTNTAGGFICACNAGFGGDGVVCVDTDECALGTDDCDVNAACTNTAGGFTCACNVNYVGDGVTCSLAVFCGNGALDGGEACDDGGLAAGDGCDESCVVEMGYGCLGEPSVCSDLDECALGTDNCDVNAACTNNAGGFSCACNAGFGGDGVVCVDTDECSLGVDNCDVNAACTNNAGGFSCACNAGFSGDGVVCVDTDECALGADDCAADAICTNTFGGFTCACGPGFWGSGVACLPHTVCGPGSYVETSGTPMTDQVCASCPGGQFSIGANEPICTAWTTCSPGMFVQIPGSSTQDQSCAVCAPGTTTTAPNETSCQDVNECALGIDDCDANATCTNFPGGFSCACNVGYTGDGRTCSCPAGFSGPGCGTPMDCMTVLTSGLGGVSGLYLVDPDGDGAVAPQQVYCDMDYAGGGWNLVIMSNPGGTNTSPQGTPQPSVSAHLASSVMRALAARSNTVHLRTAGNPFDSVTSAPGSMPIVNLRNGFALYRSTAEYTASDWTGPRVGNMWFSCQPDTSPYPALVYHGCGNPNGLHWATTSTQWDWAAAQNPLEMYVRQDPCGSCSAGTECSHLGGSAFACVDVNECALGMDNCDANATCTNTPGGFTCACNGGYTGDGVTCVPAAGAPLPVTAGLLAHWKADFGVTVDGANDVVQWADASGNGNDLVPWGTNGPSALDSINGRPSLDFAGNRRMLSPAIPLPAEPTIFIVFRQQGPATWGALAHSGSRDTDWSIEQNGFAGGDVMHFQSANDNAGANLNMPSGGVHVVSARVTGNLREFWSDDGTGEQYTSASGVSLNVGAFMGVAVGSSDAFEASNASIAEVLYFNRSLTNAERASVVGYLEGRWLTTVPTGLVHCWDGDGTGADVVSGNTAFTSTGTTYAGGVAGQAFVCDGSSAGGSAEDIHATSAPIVSGTGPFTFEMWANFTSANGWVIDREYIGYSGTGNPLVSLQCDGSANCTWTIRGDSGASLAVFGGNLGGGWHHFGIVRDGGSWSAYRDGVVVQQQPDTVGTLTVDPPRWCGHAQGGSTVSGSFDTMRIWNRGLSQTEMQNVHGNPAGGCFATP